MIDLADYRDLVALDVPFASAEPAQAPGIERLLGQLVGDMLSGWPKGGAAARRMRQAGRSERDVLRGLLTMRPAEPFFSLAFHARLDALLQFERTLRPPTDSCGLQSVAQDFPGTPYASAATCALWQGDITDLRVDAAVNAANAALLGCFGPFHACIDNSLHAAAGPRLREDCQRLMTLQGHEEPTGTAKLTRGYNLPARYVLHTVGPICQGRRNEPTGAQRDALAACYRACLDLTLEVPGVRSVAFCGISTGVFGFPRDLAAPIALATVDRWLQEHPGALERIVFNVFGAADRDLYRGLFAGAATRRECP